MKLFIIHRKEPPESFSWLFLTFFEGFPTSRLPPAVQTAESFLQ